MSEFDMSSETIFTKDNGDGSYEMWMVAYSSPIEGWTAGGGTFRLSDYPDEISWAIESHGLDHTHHTDDLSIAVAVFKNNWADFPLEGFDTAKEAMLWLKEQMS